MVPKGEGLAAGGGKQPKREAQRMESAEARTRVSVLPEYDRSALPVAETSLSRAERLRLSLVGLTIGVIALGGCTVLGVVIRAAIFGG